MSPLRTRRAPTQSTPTIPANTRKITDAVIMARALMRRRAVAKEFSTAPPNAARS
jgi:hypothetical protein